MTPYNLYNCWVNNDFLFQFSLTGRKISVLSIAMVYQGAMGPRGIQIIRRYPYWNCVRGLYHPMNVPNKSNAVMEREEMETFFFCSTGYWTDDPLHKRESKLTWIIVQRCSSTHDIRYLSTSKNKQYSSNLKYSLIEILKHCIIDFLKLWEDDLSRDDLLWSVQKYTTAADGVLYRVRGPRGTATKNRKYMGLPVILQPRLLKSHRLGMLCSKKLLKPITWQSSNMNLLHFK